jgi:hypothetical protein
MSVGEIETTGHVSTKALLSQPVLEQQHESKRLK